MPWDDPLNDFFAPNHSQEEQTRRHPVPQPHNPHNPLTWSNDLLGDNVSDNVDYTYYDAGLGNNLNLISDAAYSQPGIDSNIRSNNAHDHAARSGGTDWSGFFAGDAVLPDNMNAVVHRPNGAPQGPTGHRNEAAWSTVPNVSTAATVHQWPQAVQRDTDGGWAMPPLHWTRSVGPLSQQSPQLHAQSEQNRLLQFYMTLAHDQGQLIEQLRDELRLKARSKSDESQEEARTPPETPDDLPANHKRRAAHRQNLVVKKPRRSPNNVRLPALPSTQGGADKRGCIRCARNKKACLQSEDDPDGFCIECKTVSPISLRIPCVKARISDGIWFRSSTVPEDTWTYRVEVSGLLDLEKVERRDHFKMVSLTQDHGASVDLFVQRFEPVEGDRTAYHHVLSDGSEYTLQMPCFALANIEQAKAALNNFVEHNIDCYLENHIDADDLFWGVFQVALRRARWPQTNASSSKDKDTLLRDTLRLWMASRLIEKPWRICGDETLGMKAIDQALGPYAGIIPVTPMMDVQLDQTVIQSILIPLHKRVASQLQRQISKKANRSWFNVFASIFILLSNIEIATSHDHEHAQLHGYHTPGRGSRFCDYRLIEGYFHSAQMLIAYFRDTLHGQVPFHKDWLTDPNLAETTGIDLEEAKFLSALRDHLQKQKAACNQLKIDHKYESRLYWIHQLFYDTWESGPVHIREMD